MYGSPPPTKSPLIKRERRGEKDLLRWVTDVCNHERCYSTFDALGPFTKVRLFGWLKHHLVGKWELRGNMILSWKARTNLCLQRSGSSGESIVIVKRRDCWLVGWLGVLPSFSSSSSHLTLFFGTYVIKQTFAVSVGSRGRGLIHYRRDRQNICFGICSSDNKNIKQIVLQ